MTWTAIAALVVAMTLEAVWVSPAAQDALGIARPRLTGSFEICGLHLHLKDAYADSAWTVLTFSGMPPKMVTGGVLWDQFGYPYPGELARNNDAGDIAMGFKAANPLVALAGLRFTMTMTACDPDPEHHGRSVAVAQGSVVFDRGSPLPAPAPGRLGDGEITFESVRYGGGVLALGLRTSGIRVTGGWCCGEVYGWLVPSIEVRLIPNLGGSAQSMPYRTQTSGDATEVHVIAMLVTPGPYTLEVSLGQATLERTIVVG